jgi:hypothetical protein
MKIKFVFAAVFMLCMTQTTEAAGRCRLFRKTVKSTAQCVKSIPKVAVATVKAPIVFFQEVQPVRSVINSIPAIQSRNCADGTCSLK